MVWWWVAGAVVAAVGAMVASDSSSSSSSYSTSGPSRDELKQAESKKMVKEIKEQCVQLLKRHDRLGLAYGQKGKQIYLDACEALSNDPLVADSFSEITNMALYTNVNWENVVTVQLTNLRTIQNQKPECGSSMATCMDMLCGLSAWEPLANPDATLQSLMESCTELVAERESAARSGHKSSALAPRFVVRMPQEMPGQLLRLYQVATLLAALKDIESYADSKEVATYAASQPDFDMLLAQWRVLNKAQHNPHPRVVVCGLLKAGKSTLLNMLTENYENECFPSARTRKTTTLQTALHGQLCYVDTPGLDAPEADEKAAWSAFSSAEKVLFVVSAEQDMERTELEILQRLSAERSDFSEICTVVVTHMDALGLEEADSSRKLQSVREIIMEATGADLPVFPVSSTTYRKGILEIKPVLRRRGGIDVLREHVQLIHAQNVSESRAERLNTLKQSMCAPLYEEFAAIQLDIEKTKCKVGRQNDDMLKAMDTFLSGVHSRLHNYDNM